MKTLLSTAAGAALALAAFAVTPAHAVLQLSISANGQTFSCADGGACDMSTGANNVLVLNTAVGGATVEVTLALSTFGGQNELQLSSSSIVNSSGAPIDIRLLASDIGFTGPINAIRESSSLTFNNAVGSAQSQLAFWADPANTQGANPTNTPGTLLFTAVGTPLTDPDSFDGTHTSLFDALGPYSMTEGASLNLAVGGNITGFNQAMQSQAIPEPRTWAMLLIGFALMGVFGRAKRGFRDRLAAY